MDKEAVDKNWDAPAETSFEKANRYRAREGWSDAIVVLSDCKSMPRHWTGNKCPGQAFYLRCLCEDNAPCCEEFGEPVASNTVYILHVAERKGDGKWVVKGEPKVWGFSDDVRKNKLSVLIRDFFGGDIKKFKRSILIITCSDQKYQKTAIMPYNGNDVVVTDEMKEAVKECVGMFRRDITIDRANIVEFLHRLQGDGVGDTGSVPAEDVGEIDLESELGEISQEADNDDIPF